MIRILFSICTICIINIHTAFCQDRDSVSAVRTTHPFYLKLNPLALLELDGGIGFSGEYVWTKRHLGFQLEVQPIFLATDYIFGSDDGSVGFEAPANTLESALPTGIELRPEIRYYFKGKQTGLYNQFVHFMKHVTPFRRRKAPLQTYAAIDFLYKYTRRERVGELPVSNGGISAGYLQRATYTDIKKVIGFDCKIGALSPVRKSDHWLIEAYIGLGYRQKRYSYKNIPLGVSEPARNTAFSTRSIDDLRENLGMKINGISLPAGLKLVYRL